MLGNAVPSTKSHYIPERRSALKVTAGTAITFQLLPPRSASTAALQKVYKRTFKKPKQENRHQVQLQGPHGRGARHKNKWDR